MLTNADIQPIMVALYRLADRGQEPLNVLVATLATVPPIVVLLVFQRQIIRGIALTGLKG